MSKKRGGDQEPMLVQTGLKPLEGMGETLTSDALPVKDELERTIGRAVMVAHDKPSGTIRAVIELDATSPAAQELWSLISPSSARTSRATIGCKLVENKPSDTKSKEDLSIVVFKTEAKPMEPVDE